MNAFTYSLRKILFFFKKYVELALVYLVRYINMYCVRYVILKYVIWFFHNCLYYLFIFLQNRGKFGVYIPIHVTNNARAYIEMILWFLICTCHISDVYTSLVIWAAIWFANQLHVHASVMHKYIATEPFQNTVNNEMRINVSQHATCSLTEIWCLSKPVFDKPLAFTYCHMDCHCSKAMNS